MSRTRTTQTRSRDEVRIPLWWWAVIGVLLVGVAAVIFFRPSDQTPDSLMTRSVDFQQYHYGMPPDEFDYAATGPHQPVLNAGQPYWRTYRDLFAPSPEFVLIQAATLAEPDHYPIALLKEVRAADVMVQAWVKLMGGDLAQSAGILWRAEDYENYYAVMLDAQADAVYLIRMTGGKPQMLESASIPIEVEAEQRTPMQSHGWYPVRVEMIGARISVWLADQQIMQVEDNGLRQAGRVGLISHADSVAVFDDLYVQTGGGFITPTPRPPAAAPIPPVMHVASIKTTDASYQSPQTEFSRGDESYVYWIVEIVDQGGQPVPAALITVEVLRPDGTLLCSEEAMAGSFGTALFRCEIGQSEPAGQYTLRVTKVKKADNLTATYDAGANTQLLLEFAVK